MNPVVMLTNAVVPDKLGGLERYVGELAAELAARGTDVTVVTKRMDPAHPDRELTPGGVRIARFDVPSKRNPLFALLYPWAVARGVRRVLREQPEAAVHAHFVVPALALALMPARWRRPYLYTFHAPVHRELLAERQGSYLLPRPLQRAAVSLLRRAERLVVERAAGVLVLSEFMRAEVAGLSPSAGARAHLVPGGVDTEWFCPGSAADDAWASEAEKLLVTARRLTPRTGVLELIRAMPTVVAARPGTRLAVMGDGRLRTQAEDLVTELGVSGSVRLMGRVPDEDLRAWYRRADLAVTPTQELEGFGLSTAEAMACGAPPLVTPVGANPELVGDLPDAALARGTAPRDLADAVLRVLDAPAVPRQRLRDLALEWSWDAVAAAHEPHLAGLGRGRGEGPS